MTQVIAAIFKRNFSSYFSSPTGYAFICVFVLLSSIAAFYPDEFFAANLANLDQLNRYLPLILLVFIPAITMSIWADERRQGTDELLLTIPATDFAVVMGKYLAAVAIFSVALAFSCFCNFVVLLWLGQPDVGLLAATYVGYWFVGLAMLAIGMVGSFLTGNLTVAFILGALLNAPLVFAMYADRLLPTDMPPPEFLSAVAPDLEFHPARAVSAWSIEDQFRDFSRGIISLSAVAYFLLIVVVMLYVSIVLIGRRHWKGGQKGGKSALLAGILAFFFNALGMLYSTPVGAAVVLGLNVIPLVLALNEHYFTAIVVAKAIWLFGIGWAISAANDQRGPQYFVRVMALILIAGCVVVLCSRPPLAAVRLDVSSEQLNRLSDPTRELIRNLDPQHPIRIDAFISPEVPEAYVPTRLDLLNTLREIGTIGGGKVIVQIHDTEPLSDAADRAEKLYGIEPRQIQIQERSTVKVEELFLGVAMTSGLKKIVVPFFDHGLPVEYELARSIATVARQSRKKLGVLTTEAQLFGSMDFMGRSPRQQIIDELEKQYTVIQVDPEQPIFEEFDVLLAVQPSSLTKTGMENFIEVVRRGQPTAIFEDPFPLFAGSLTPTGAPRQQDQMSMLGGGPPPQPKGNIQRLWELLGVDFQAFNVVWQDFNPHPKYDVFLKEFIFISNEEPGADGDALNPESPITQGLQEVLFLFGGWITPREGTPMNVKKLAVTGNLTGEMPVNKILQPGARSREDLDPNRVAIPTHQRYTMAAEIRGTPTNSMAEALVKASGADPSMAVGKEINVVLVADVDWIYSIFFMLRSQGSDLDFDNVSLVLNILDSLAGEKDFIEIRRHRPKHRTLDRITAATEAARSEALAARHEAVAESNQKEAEIRKKFALEIEKLQNRKGMDQAQLMRELSMHSEVAERRLIAMRSELSRELEEKKKAIDKDLEREVRSLHSGYKLWAALLPPIPPLLVGLGVYFRRRAREREGVSRARLR